MADSQSGRTSGTGRSSRVGTGRRLSWADQIPTADGVPPAPLTERRGEDGVTEAVQQWEIENTPDPPGQLTVRFGMLSVGKRYGLTAAMPAGTRTVEVIDPNVPGMKIEVTRSETDDSLCLRVELHLEQPGRYDDLRFNARLDGDAGPQELLVIVEAHVMHPSHGRPSQSAEGVEVLSSLMPKEALEQTEGALWTSSRGLAEDAEDGGGE